MIIGIIFLGIEIRGNTIATEAANLQIATELDQSFLLEIGLTLNFAARIKLRRTSAVTVASADLGFLTRNVALLGHK